MKKSMKIHAYDVVSANTNANLENAITHYAGLSLELRTLNLGGSAQEIRLEAAQAPQSLNNPTAYWLLDFTKSRYENGPGKVSKATPITGFNLAENEGFGEETAALYDPAKKSLLIQYNHYGPRQSAISDYFSHINHTSPTIFAFNIKLDKTAEARLSQKNVIKKFHYKIATPSISSEMRHSNASLGQALGVSDSLNGKHIEITVSAGAGPDELNNSVFQKMLAGIKQLQSSDPTIVESLVVTAKNTHDERSEAINLLLPMLKLTLEGLVLGDDRRFTRESRWNALVRAHNAWKGLL
jgi:hypothetical protein